MNSVDPLVAIIILNWNGKQDTLNCLESLKSIKYSNYEIVLVDNGSTDDSPHCIQEAFPDVTLLCNRKNLGFAEGNNVGISHALKMGAEYLLLLNNDTIVDPNLISSFVTQAQNQKNHSILGGRVYLFDDKKRFDHFGGIWNAKKAAFDLVANRLLDDGKSYEKPQELDYICGCCLFAKREVFETVGLLDARFFLMWEESDWCFRAKKLGYRLFTCPKAKIWHKVSASFTGGKSHTTYFWWRNRLLWIEKNCSFKEKIKLLAQILLPEIFHLLKLRFLKRIQLRLLKLFRPHENHLHREQKLKTYVAALTGVKDYLRRRFGNGPKWLFQ